MGISSFGALGEIKRSFGTRKVGHTGTLDPFASGLLLALVGPSTRLARYFNKMGKVYETEFRFGAATDTDDSTGSVVQERALPNPDRVRDLVDQYTGELFQIPPRYSAVHINGRRAYELARQGKDPEIPGRTVRIERFELLSLDASGLRARIACSAGAYIRSIARDLGADAGSCGHVTELRRVGIGPFDVEEAAQAESAPRLLGPLEALARVPDITVVEIPDETVPEFMHGREPPASLQDSLASAEGPVVIANGGALIAVGRWAEEHWNYDLVRSNAHS